ncbi:MAG: hypothetical protein H0U94_11670 [Acidobacteria bacterium]|nr:hypothetical protein [Acidobacteriota bacterium]
MKRWTAVFVLTLVSAVQIASAQPPPDDRGALRAQIEERFDVVPLTGGIALRPRKPMQDVRLIEITEGTVLINGSPVTGRELRERLGRDADAILQLSYLTPDAARVPVEPPEATADAQVEPEPLEAPSPPAAPIPPVPPIQDGRHSSGDRVRIFGNVSVGADEVISGQAVAVLGSVRVDGEVADQVVAVLGSVTLGPKALVRGDVVSIGGRVHRSEGSQIRGNVTEVSVADPNVHLNFPPLAGWSSPHLPSGFSAVPRLIGTTFRLLLLVMLVSIAFVVARRTVEASAQRVSDSPVQSTLVGVVAQLLLIPALVLTVIVLAISIVGIPLLLLVPFAILVLILLALAGFSGTVYAVGQRTRRKMGLTNTPPFVDILMGVLVILLPILLARLVAFAGWPLGPLGMLLVAIGVAVEFLAWSSGFGAVLTNGFTRWQARRAARTYVPPPAMP